MKGLLAVRGLLGGPRSCAAALASAWVRAARGAVVLHSCVLKAWPALIESGLEVRVEEYGDATPAPFGYRHKGRTMRNARNHLNQAPFARLALLASTLLLAAGGLQASGGSTTPACAYDSFGRTADGSTFWASTGQSSVQGLLVGQMNCLLDQFAMNNFLYLVGGDSAGKLRFMGYAPWYSLFTASGTPSWPGSYQPLSPTQLNRFDNQTQAGDGFLLKDVNGLTTSYDIRVNQTFFDYVATNSLYTRSGFNSALKAFNTNSATGGVWFPPTRADDTSEGAVELKTAWRNFGPLPAPAIDVGANAPTSPCPDSLMHCEQDSSGNFWGLVGFHLVQKTVDQPGFVWATFEHVGNVPDCSAGGAAPINQNPVSPATGAEINLNANLPGGIGAQTGWNYFNHQTYQAAGGDGRSCSYPTSQQTDTQCLGVPQDASKNWIAVNICRTLVLPEANAATCAGSSVDGTNLTATACLNDSVRSNFASTGLDAKWMNYQLVAMEWLTDGATGFGTFAAACLTYDETGAADTACPNYKPASHELGEGGGVPNFGRVGSGSADQVSPANTTMETWMQYGLKVTSDVGQNDCFQCHQPSTQKFGQGDFSHLFGRIQQD